MGAIIDGSNVNDIYYITQGRLNAVIWIGFTLALSFTALRTWLQYSHNRRFYINDVFMIVALLFDLIMSILWTLKNAPMYEFMPIAAGAKMPELDRMYYYNYFLLLEFVILIFWWTQLWLVKLALLTFFWRLFDSVRSNARVFWWVMLGITLSTWVVAIFLHIFSCLPVGSFWHLGSCDKIPANAYRARLTFRFGSITDILTDFFIMLVPFALLRKLQVNTRQKIILVIIFLTPLLPITFGILRLSKTNVRTGSVDPLRNTLFSSVETTFSIIAASLPSIRLFFLNKKPSASSSAQYYRYDQTPRTPWNGSSSKSLSSNKNRSQSTSKGGAQLELSTIAEAFHTSRSGDSTEKILEGRGGKQRDIYVRKDVEVRRYDV